MTDQIQPPAADAGAAPDDRRIGVVVDAATGEPIPAIIAADVAAGTVRRFEVLDGNLVRVDDAFVIIDEQREIRIEWTTPAAAEAEDAG